MSLATWTPTINWGDESLRKLSMGLDRGVLYINGIGVGWSGLVRVNQNTDSSTPEKRYFDGRLYEVYIPTKDYAGTLEAFMYPDEFERCIGTVPVGNTGLFVHGQESLPFSISYRTMVVSGDGSNTGYKTHFLYDVRAQASAHAHETINANPQGEVFSFDLFGIPITVPNAKPTSYFSIDSRRCDPWKLQALEKTLYGENGSMPVLPSIADVTSVLT